MPITAKDIARELNLSQPTVSRVLSGDKQHRVSETTRQRILDAAKRLRYQPNAVARSLRRGRTGIIGLYTNHNYDVRNDFLGAIIGSLQHGCALQNLDLLLHSALYGRSAEDVYAKLRDGRIDGLILHADPDDALVEILGKSPLPVVAVADRMPNLPTVTCEDADGMHQLIAHLWERGHRKFAYLSPQKFLVSANRREAAFLAEMRSRGLAASDYHVLPIDYEATDLALDNLRQEGRPLAVCCWNDRTAYNLLHSCLERGVRVPEEIAITGFDGFRSHKAPAQQLVTVDCHWGEVASTALGILTNLINGQTDASELQEVCLPVTLLAGDTA